MSLFTFSFKNFIYMFFITTIIFFVSTLVMIEIKLSKNSNINEEKNLLLTGNGSFVAFGDSRVERSLTSNQNFNNLGKRGLNIDAIYQRVKYKISNSSRKIKGVVLQADPHMFSFYRLVNNKTSENNNINDLKKFKFLDSKNRIYLIEHSKDVWKNLLIKQENKKKMLNISKNWDNEALIRVQLHNPVNNFLQMESLIKYTKMVYLLKNKNIDICLISFPVSENYNNYSKKFDNFIKAKNFFKDLAFKNNIKYFDLSKLFENSKFNDADHIKSDFSKYFTEIVQNKCQYKLVDD